MAAFQYTAARADGASTRGLVEADSPRQARAELRRQGLLPLDIAEVRAGAARDGFALRRDHLRGPELALLTRQLAVMVDGGLPLTGTRTVITTYAAADQPYAAIAAQQDGEERAAAELARLIRLDLMQALSNR